MNRVTSAALLTLTLALASCNSTAPQDAGLPMPSSKNTVTEAPIYGNSASGEYIVVFRKTATVQGQSISKLGAGQVVQMLGLEKQGVQVQAVYSDVLDGFAAKLSGSNVQKLTADPRVAYLQAVQTYHAVDTQTSPPSWGLDRIDQQNLPLSNSYTYSTSGTGVTAYILDTGLNTTHVAFSGRASIGYDVINDGQNGKDCQGHGTHVAGTIGSSTYGVAKNVKLVAVRVLGCDGTGSNQGIIQAINWVAQNAQKPAVVNMSLGPQSRSVDQAMDDAIASAISRGITFVLAAGNSNDDACYYSPARTPAAITVASSTSTDARSSFSNYGTCVDIFAPGSNITSTWIGSTTATNTISGTSMASPHTAGAAALVLSANPAFTPQQVRDTLVNTATQNKITDPKGTANRLLFVGQGTTQPPTTDPCSGTNCSKYTGSLSSGQSAYQPNNTYFNYAGGTLKGWLKGPSGSDFDLVLYKWNGSAWQAVSRAETSSSDESITYNAGSGYYTWEVVAYSGSGSYSFWMQK
ncbi:S8 family peptidase [Deinococcus roseus]|uniref:Peptidase S8 n=1 Tax=Deinococcus roseus TaxID=392414 RepID=A0ABQ2CZG6_9DEIO|nr:S8 family peptidase [Deinococcus roseus]GGJ36338.1 hypothetical protein GCM10008938_23020 [Deinococcus roseus]